jgi:hypothetical protein
MRFHKTCSLLLCSFILLCLNSCRNKVEFTPNVAIISLSKNYGRANERITITGTGFDEKPAGNKVTFNGKTATVTAATFYELTVLVPKGAETGEIRVTVKNNSATGPVFNYIYEMTVSTLAGNDYYAENVDGIGDKASFRDLYGIAADSRGNIYITDRINHVVRKVSATGSTTTFAGNGSAGYKDGNGREASFYTPTELVVDRSDNIYVSDKYNEVIRKITPEGVVTTLAGKPGNLQHDGKGSGAGFWTIGAMTIDELDNVYVTDGDQIRKISPDGVVSTPVTSFGIIPTFGLTRDKDGFFYVSFANGISKIIDSKVGYLNFMGDSELGYRDGLAMQARFRYIAQTLYDRHGNLIILDSDNGMIRELTITGDVITLLGKQGTTYPFHDGPADQATFNAPFRMAMDAKGSLYVLDETHRVRKIIFE